MFGSSPETAGFLDIQWADIVFILVLRGHVRYIIINNITLLHDCILTLGEIILNPYSGVGKRPKIIFKVIFWVQKSMT